MEVIINGVVYVPKEKSELNLLKEKYESGSYICIGNRVGSIDKISELDWPKWHADWEYKLIHKKHKNILDAWLADNNVEIEWFNVDGFYKCKYFIESYNENFNYRLKQQYPIFKRNEDGEVFKYHSNGNITCVLSTHNIGQVFTEYNSKVCKFNISGVETIPFDEERGLYHLQPVWCWSDADYRRYGFYSVLQRDVLHKGHYHNIEQMTPEQLKVMPFVWDMYQQVLKDKQ